MAGGVALNCVANGKILKEKIFDSLWIQPAAGDAGGALGAALFAWHQVLANPREGAKNSSHDSQQGSYLGSHYANPEIASWLESEAIPYSKLDDAELYDTSAALLAQGFVLGWFQGRMEFGPRALGGRSILGDPRNPEMQSRMNLKIKFRESFRPFAPSCLAEQASEYFELAEGESSPYMLLTANVRERHRLAVEDGELFGIEKLNQARSSIPAVTHVDYSARVQTVDGDANPRFHALLSSFAKQTNCPILINTSFNVRGEPIVESPLDAFKCFCSTGMDALALENCLIKKADLSAEVIKAFSSEAYELD
ncbi:UNVERIFIED_CONTAM: hypothetical protein GTU68_066486 [Idotea baltica]|nr:hypothetical protein [Idotea baltica]